MNKSLIFRILGALSSALIVVAVFVPFFMVDGYSESLWYSGEQANAIFLPILIIIFGMIGIIFFALNYKTEFAYSTCGAIIFYVIMITVDYINQDKFETLSMGYYLLVVGAILTGIMAFITNKKSKIKVIDPVTETPKQEISLEKINGLYNSPQEEQNIPAIQPLDNVISPMQEQPINQIPIIEPVQNNVNVSSIPEPINIEIPSVQPIPVQEPEVNPVLQQFNTEIPGVQPTSVQEPEVNPVLQQFNTEIPSVQPTSVQEPEVNPVLQQFNTEMPSVQPTVVQEPEVNPILQQFNTEIPSAQPSNSSLFNFGTETLVSEPIQTNSVPLSNINNGVSEVQQQENVSNTDIFGQPIN